MVFAHGDVIAGEEFCAALADDYASGFDELITEYFDAESFRYRIATVIG